MKYFHVRRNRKAKGTRFGAPLFSRLMASPLSEAMAIGKILICITILIFNQLPVSAASYLGGEIPIMADLTMVSRGQNWILVQSEILSDGGAGVTERGVIYSISGANNYLKISSGTGTGAFSIKLTDLEANKTYVIKSYAVNAEGLSYSAGIEIKTQGAPLFTSLITPAVDYGKSYQSVIKIRAEGGLETKVTAAKKPGWLFLRSDPEVQTFAGTGNMGSSNGPVLQATFQAPYALASDIKGSLYVADQVGQCIRKISDDGGVTLLAGGYERGYQNGTGSEARFDSPSGIAVDASGNVYVSDQNNNCIRKISSSGDVSTFAGSRSPGYADGKGAEARFNHPAGLAVDDRGYVFVADRGNNLIRVINPQGEVSTLAGTRKAGFADGTGGVAMFNAPTGIAVSNSGDIYVADQVNNRIRKITSLGLVSTLAGNGLLSSTDGKGLLAGFSYPTGLAINADGTLFLTDQLNHRIRRISQEGTVSTVAGSDPGFAEGIGNSAKFRNPSGICIGRSGDIFVADLYNFRIRKIITDAVLSGTPSRSDVGASEVILQATNEAGTTTQTLSLIVKDELSPELVSFSPAAGSASVSRSTELVLTFDEAVSLADSGSVIVYNDKEILKTFNIETPIDRDQFLFSADRKSLRIGRMNELPPNALIRIQISKGAIRDSSQNRFQGLSGNSWNFITKALQRQSLNLEPFAEKMYGDTAFILGPSLSSAGLPVIYTAEDTTVLTINGTSATILRAGETKITASLSGTRDYASERITRTLVARPRVINIQPAGGQRKSYGDPDPEIKFSILSGTVVNGDKFAGKLNRVAGDTVGVYPIIKGTLALGASYQINLQNEAFAITKAPLLIVADNKAKIAGQPDPEFTSSFQGFKNGDTVGCLLSQPQMVSKSHSGSAPGEYRIEIAGAAAKNYELSYKEGLLKVISPEVPDFYLAVHTLIENRPANSLAGALIFAQETNASFSLVEGAGDSENELFKIDRNLILTRTTLDYEDKKIYSIRVKATGLSGGVKEKVLTIALVDINEAPQMDPIAARTGCSSGTIVLHGITAGQGENQSIRVHLKSADASLFKTLHVSEVLNGEATITYSLADPAVTTARFEILLKDNGGVEDGGIDSAVYSHTFKFSVPPVVSITSDKGSDLVKGEQALLTVSGGGTYRWSDSKGVISGQNAAFLRVNPSETTVYKVEVVNEAGCATEKEFIVKVRESSQVVCYNVITPNDDGKNDFFIVKNIDLFPENELKIYDRNGKIVYNRKHYSNEWNGTYRGMALPGETYYYSLDLGPGKEKLKGFLLIID